jgi:hypothetical protein
MKTLLFFLCGSVANTVAAIINMNIHSAIGWGLLTYIFIAIIDEEYL